MSARVAWSTRIYPVLYLLTVFCTLTTVTVYAADQSQAGDSDLDIKRIVVLFDERIELPGISIINDRLSESLRDAYSYPLEIYREEMDLSRFASDSRKLLLKNYLTEKYSNVNIDVVVAVMGSALDFMLAHGNDIFPNASVVFCGIDRQELRNKSLPDHYTGVFLKRQFAPTLDLVMTLHPELKKVQVISGASEFDARLLAQARMEFREFESWLDINYMTALPMPDLMQKIDRLPQDSVILYISIFKDGAGTAFVPQKLVKQISDIANVPVYGFVEQYLGQGIVGGHLYSLQMQGNDAANMVVEILNGEEPAKIPMIEQASSKTQFDWRQLNRWNISESKLPGNAVVKFQEQSLWTQYRDVVTIALIILIIQALLIGGLLVQRYRLHRAQNRLTESEARFRNMADNAPVMIWMSDLSKQFEFLNKAWLEFKGRNLEQEVGRDWTEDLHGNDIALYRGVIEAGFDNNTPFNVELRMRRKDGLYRWILCKGIPRYTSSKSFRGFIGSAIDITDRREQENELLASEERYRHLIESQLDLVCRFLPDATLTFVNEAYCRFFDMTRDALMGRQFVELMLESTTQSFMDQFDKVIKECRRCSFDYKMELKNGNSGWYQWEVYPIVDDQGNIREIQAIARDISDRKRAEEANKNLTHAMRLAVAGELTAMVAHEVSQPLGAIMANADAAQIMLQSKNPPIAELRQVLEDIRASDQRANLAIRRIRDLLRRREMKMQPIDLNDTVSSALQLVNGDALLRNVQIKSQFSPALPQAMGDQVYLQQVLLNLIINGMDAMNDTPRKDRLLTIETKPMQGRQIGVVVSDNGKGVAADKMKDIFGSFYTTKKHGMGLGLTICQSIIESHHGKIWVENRQDGGSTFQFSLQVA